jgi:murein DD-endopeptidase MepM/ murein hydrolase activator NlpD
MSQYIFDKNNFRFKKVTRTVGSVLKTVLKYFIATVSLSVVCYIVFAFFFSTDKERQIRRENRMYQKMYPDMAKKERLLTDVVRGLQVKDNDIYEQIFHTDAPAIDPVNSTGILSDNDSIPDKDIVEYTEKKADLVLQDAARIDADFKDIFSKVGTEGYTMPPMTIPVEGITYAQVGASVGQKINPFYKVPVQHDGLDLLSSQEDPVYAAADGTVSDVEHSHKGLGNVVEINHGNGYVTRYAHLSDIVVSKGQHVIRGKRLGSVGVSGNSFAPHLHYEVYKDDVVQNPINYFFASLTPNEYANFMFMSVNTGQSMD